MIEEMTFDAFARRHIGPTGKQTQEMLQAVGVANLEELIDSTVPSNIRSQTTLDIPDAQSEFEYLHNLKLVAAKNQVFKSYIGMGYYGCITPSVILRNIFQNPGWYTQYTPYQAEIAQGRLEALLNFQTVVSDLTALPIANASLLDEGTAAAEAMLMFHALKNKRPKGDPANTILVSDQVLPQTIEVLNTRAEPHGIEVKVLPEAGFEFADPVFAVLLQYPDKRGTINDYRQLAAEAKNKGVYVIAAADILSLALITPPGEWGADAAVGNTQRFGVPMGYGGPHAAYFATKDEFKRNIPGRIIGVSVDSQNNPALRMALQTREQHIRREKATSNICTAQALLAIMAGMYAVYHGPEGLYNIARRIHHFAGMLAGYIQSFGYDVLKKPFFDTIQVLVEGSEKEKINQLALKKGYNFFYQEDSIGISLDETIDLKGISDILNVFSQAKGLTPPSTLIFSEDSAIPPALSRQTDYLTHPVFQQYRTETTMMRYIKRLENRDLSLTHAMIPLGSCTMKLNAATELFPVSWPEFADIHPFAPVDQTAGYQQIFRELEAYLCEITGFAACSLQPNSGAQGEYAGLMVIRAYHLDRGEGHRKVALIPSSAHGTNPASAVMAGMEVVVVECDTKGNIDLTDLKNKAVAHKDKLAALLVTYPSTHGVFETSIMEICDFIHECGGLVYMDGANMNAQVGLTSPGSIHADVCHLNLHKTFAIPHGGGGPGMGPICVNEKLKPYLPTHPLVKTGGEKAIRPVSAAPWGSASILLISYGYIKMLGAKGLTDATRYAILNANYIKSRLHKDYAVLYTGENGHAAHELIIDLRAYKDWASAEDVAKRLIDYGFHAPTVSFPVAGTLMIEPTESENKAELDRFCEAMIQIKREMEEIMRGEFPLDSNVLVNAPHTAAMVSSDDWNYPYSREKAAYPLPYLREGYKFWPYVGRVNNAHGDRNLVCTCPPMEEYR